MSTTLINLYGAPCSGKTTIAFKVAYRSKKDGFSTALVQEYATELIWEDRLSSVSQFEITEEMIRRLSLPIGKVDVIVCECPIHLNILYDREDSRIPKLIEEFYEQHKMEIYNFFLPVNLDKWTEKNRIHTPEEALIIQGEILKMFKEYNITYEQVKGAESLPRRPD